MFGDRKAKGEDGYDEHETPFEVDKEKQEIVVKTIFRKAQSEHAYANFYAKLCSQIARLELTIKGLAPTRANAKKCVFREELLRNCKSSFDLLLNAPEKEERKEKETEEDRLDRELRTKHKLFGNIDFVGELYKELLISDVILTSIFENLLGIDTQSDSSVTDMTIDAALKLINKLGKKMEDSVNTLKNEEKKTARLETNAKIFKAFSNLQAELNPKASTRVKLLIKNMFENRASHWSKSKDEDKEIKKKAEIEASIFKQAEQKLKESEMEDSRGGYSDKKGRDNMNQSQNYNNNKGKGGNNLSLQKSRTE
jgi:hypothetical protein